MQSRKEAARLFWSVKGYLMPDDWSDEDVEGMVRSYTKRVWHNHEANDIGFEEAWAEKYTQMRIKEKHKIRNDS